MRTSQYLLATVKETPADAVVISHQLMLRAGMVRKLASGLYNWLPTGLRVLRKVEQIVREEMDRAGAQEVLMPVVQPMELWEESGRAPAYGPELLRITDRHNNPFCLGPTHEEVITDLVRNELHSYKQLPANFYQIQTKFRDEIRPRFGIMRSREFIMKDAYSFHADMESLAATYQVMHQAYCAIFDRLGLDYRPVEADTGAIGGAASHEFHVLADSGEDDIAFSDSSDYAANVELAEALAPATERPAPGAAMEKVDTPNAKTIEELVAQFDLPMDKTVKTLVVKGAEEGQLVALLVRGDHELNDIKAEKLDAVAAPMEFASEEEIRQAIGAGPGSLGPVGLPIPIVIDRSVAVMSDFCAGARALAAMASRSAARSTSPRFWMFPGSMTTSCSFRASISRARSARSSPSPAIRTLQGSDASLSLAAARTRQEKFLASVKRPAATIHVSPFPTPNLLRNASLAGAANGSGMGTPLSTTTTDRASLS